MNDPPDEQKENCTVSSSIYDRSAFHTKKLELGCYFHSIYDRYEKFIDWKESDHQRISK